MDPNRPAKKAKKSIRKKPKAKKPPKGSRAPYRGPLLFQSPCFNILPPHALPNTLLHISLSCLPNSVKAIADAILTTFKPYFSSQNRSKGSIDNPFTEVFYEARQEAVCRCQRIRWTFRKLLHWWRVKRLQRTTLTDIVTGLPPRREILLVDWKGRTATPFEATTIQKDITERLQLHDGFFEDPQLPRNPLTNLPLTLAQQISIWNSLSCAGIPVSSAFCEFRRVRWNLELFMNEYSVPLQLRSFQITMRDLDHEDTRERLLDFIEYAYDQEAIDCSKVSYKYALQKFQEHPLLLQWASLCTEFYSAAIVWNRLPQRCAKIQSDILDKTIDLLDRQKELVYLRNAHLKLQANRLWSERNSHPFNTPQ